MIISHYILEDDILYFVCRYIDQGRNPQLYTKECLERALARNEQVKGKIDTMTVRYITRDTEIINDRATKIFH